MSSVSSTFSFWAIDVTYAIFMFDTCSGSAAFFTFFVGFLGAAFAFDTFFLGAAFGLDLANVFDFGFAGYFAFAFGLGAFFFSIMI